jgi:hypothetical protein
VRPDSEEAGPRCHAALRFTTAALAAWRVTHLLAYEDGPAGVVAGVRSRLGEGSLGQLADCFDCLSIWVAAGLVPFATRRRRQMLASWLGLSGAACLLERALGGGPPIELDLPDGTKDADGVL